MKIINIRTAIRGVILAKKNKVTNKPIIVREML